MMQALSRKTDSDLYIPSPKGLEYMPFQKAGIEFCYKNPNHNTLIGDEPGLGKTIQLIGYCNLIGAMNILVICPASLVLNWKREVEKWHVGKPSIQVIFSSKQELDPTVDVHITSYSLTINKDIQAFLQRKEPEVMTIDEVHYLKNYKAKRTKSIYVDKGNLVRGASNVIALSGTPIVNRPIEIFQTIQTLCPKAINNMNYFEYAKRYCGGYEDGEGFHDQGATNLKELGLNLRSHFMVRREKSQVLKDLPDKTVSLVTLVPSAQAKRLVKEMNEFDVEEIVRMKGVEVSYEGLSTMRRELGVAKIPAVVEYLKTQLDGGREKIVVFAHHKEVLIRLTEELAGYNPVLIYGGTPKMKRQDLVDRFQEDPDCHVIVLGIIPGGVGLTLTAADYVAFAECSWVPGQNSQCIDRIHRIGQLLKILAEFLIYDDSLDENILISQSRKQINITKVMA